jgi:hypothetical protein
MVYGPSDTWQRVGSLYRPIIWAAEYAPEPLVEALRAYLLFWMGE